MAKIKIDGNIWGLALNWYIRFFISWQSDSFTSDIANELVDFKIQGKCHGQSNTKSHIWNNSS